MEIGDTLTMLESEPAERLFAELYGAEAVRENTERYRHVLERFQERFGQKDVLLFSSPGRTEISGNHTDHNRGKVLAGSINLDCIGAAAVNRSDRVRIVSETFGQDFSVDLNHLEPGTEKSGTEELVKGILKGFQKSGYSAGGFDAYVASNVISSAGVSSSAAFEMLLCSMVNTFFNDGRADIGECAHIGQYAENRYWDKASGLLDQMACAAGGLIAIDFADPAEPSVKKIDFDFASRGHSLILVNTGRGHADLSADYSSVPGEMKKVAEFFGKEVCAQITEEEVLANLAAVRQFAGDRAVLRALHFFEENKRVDAQVAALGEGRFDDFLRKITESGNSSWKWLQNCYPASDVREQGIPVALALTELFLAEKGRGACRVHGGGFAGVILAVLPDGLVNEYMEMMEARLGRGCAHRMSIRPLGAVCVNEAIGSRSRGR